MGFVDRPQKFLALHFAIGVWDSNIGEVMGHPDTDPAVFEQLLTFADEIGLVPIPIRKEQSGYIVNSLIVPWCTAALDLLVRGVSDFESIDRTWMITLQTGMGPCGMMDRMGLGVVHHVANVDRRGQLAQRSTLVRALHRRAVHPARPPGSHERPGLLQLPESNLRSTGLHLTQNRPTHTTGSLRTGLSAPPTAPRQSRRSIEITFDRPDELPRPARVLLPDPRPDHQEPPGNDRGLSYRSAIYYTSDDQRDRRETIADVAALSASA